MSLKSRGFIELPAHIKPGGFDHAAVHRGMERLYVAHTCNDALDVIDWASDQYLHSIPDLPGVAGALAADDDDLIFTSNRGENTVGLFAPNADKQIAKVTVGARPNGLAYAPAHNLLLAANVGDPARPNSFTVSIVDALNKTLVADVPVPGRTRWTVYDPLDELFYVNIADPAQIVVLDATNPARVARAFPVASPGPHGLDLDAPAHRLFCACDGGQVFTLDARSGAVLRSASLSGLPDVIFFNATLKHLYVAIGDPGLIEVFETETLTRLETVPTEKGAHTLGFHAAQNKVYAFLPETHRARVFVDEG